MTSLPFYITPSGALFDLFLEDQGDFPVCTLKGFWDKQGRFMIIASTGLMTDQAADRLVKWLWHPDQVDLEWRFVRNYSDEVFHIDGWQDTAQIRKVDRRMREMIPREPSALPISRRTCAGH